jgi:Transposase and inactivated derivatives
LFPARLDENIGENDLVRLINKIVDKMDMKELLSGYRGGGASAYHPRMLLKVLLYAYCMKIYSGRKIARALQRDTAFMWLSGRQTPDFRTINHFRSGRLKNGIGQIFKSLLMLMFEEGYIGLDEYYCDGSIILADANKHKATWKKNLERHRAHVESRIDETIKAIDELCREEGLLADTDTGMATPEPFGEGRIKETADKLNLLLNAGSKKAKRAAGKLHSDLVAGSVRVEVYKEKEGVCGERSGYSNTDPDAGMLRTKECQDDLRPGYNLLIGSENQYVTGVSVHQSPNDGACFKEHMEKRNTQVPRKAKVVVADAGFGTEENYSYLDGEGTGALLKYPSYDRERERKFKENPYHRENMPYDSQSDSFLCPDGKRLLFREEKETENKNKYKSLVRIYECEGCLGCPHFDQCGNKREEGQNRTVQVNEKLEGYKQKFRQLMKTEKGKARMRQRGHDVETVFGDTKQNQLFRRVHLRGIEKVTVEMTIVAIAHNLRKMNLEEAAKANELKKAA